MSTTTIPADGDPRIPEHEIVARVARIESTLADVSAILAEFREAMALWLASRAEDAEADDEGAIDAGPDGLKVSA